MAESSFDFGKSADCYVPEYRSQYHCGWLRASALCYRNSALLADLSVISPSAVTK